MTNLTRAHNELFRRNPDEQFTSLSDLWQHCQHEKDNSADRWELPQELVPTSDMTLCIGDDPDFRLNDWSFTQLCRLSGVSKDTIYAWVTGKGMPSYKVGRLWKFKKEEVDAWVREGGAVSSAPGDSSVADR